jgi:hypothetical protein
MTEYEESRFYAPKDLIRRQPYSLTLLLKSIL